MRYYRRDTRCFTDDEENSKNKIEEREGKEKLRKTKTKTKEYIRHIILHHRKKMKKFEK